MERIKYDPIVNINIYHIYEYYDEPVLFSFYNETDSLFLALFSDWDEEESTWLYVPISFDDLIKLEEKKMTIRNFIINSKTGFAYVLKESNVDDKNEYYTVISKNIPKEYLPDEGVFLNYEHKSTLAKSESIVNKVIESNRYVVDLSLDPTGNHSHEIEAESFGKILISFQELVEGMALGDDATIRSKVPTKVKEDTLMKVTGTYAASFGVRMESNKMASLISEDDIIYGCLIRVANLLSQSNDLELSKELMSNINKKAISKYKQFIKGLIETSVEGKIRTAMPIPGGKVQEYQAEFSSDNLSLLLNTIETEETENIEMLQLEGTLVSYHSETNKFKFICTKKGYEGAYTGYLAKDAVDKVFSIPSYGIINIIQTTKLKTYTGEETIKYELLSWNS